MNAQRPVCAAPALETPAPAASQSYQFCNLEHTESDSTALAEEVVLAIAYNDISQAVMLVTPTDLEDFIVGFSIGSGIIEDVSDIYDLKISGSGSTQYAQVQISSRAFWNMKQQRRQLAGTSGCGLCGVEAVEQALPNLKVLPGAPLPPAEWLDGLRQRISAFQPLGQYSGAVHAAVFMNNQGELLLGREDIGRHNALDKLIGALIRQKIPTDGGLAIVTSRCSLELIQKVLRAGIQTLVSLSSPTGLALQWARRHNLNLIHLPQKSPAGGWGALISVAQAWLTSDNALKNIRMMLKTNQNGGFDCPGCAWGDSPESGMVKFCENGAKAVNWEATKRRVDAAFFAKHSVSALLEQSDYWLEYQGRLTEPMSYDAETDRYKPISWESAFDLIGKHLNALPNPDMAEFYTSGRASNEAAYLYQLFVRAYGTNNFPDCSNMCHEASGVALAQSVGVGKGTVTFDDFEHADAIFVWGQNPGTNHPRMLEPLREAVKRGAQVVCINPLKERGLERFQHPQHPLEMLTNGDKPTNTAYFRPALGGDMAILRGMAKFLLLWERQAQAEGKEAVFDHDFLNEHTANVLDYLGKIDDTSWDEIVEQSGLTLVEIEQAARMYAKGKNVIMCWAMGITQHRHSVPTIQEIANLMLLRGNIGRPGAGLCPVRGHSNVQGDRTMGINERPPVAFLDSLERRFQFQVPRDNGHNVVEAIHAMLEGRSKVFIGLGGNFAQATPDSPRTFEALRN
eukprot:gene6498-9932_t